LFGVLSGGTAAVAQRVQLVAPTPNGGTTVAVALNYGGIVTTIQTGATATTYGDAIVLAINSSAGSVIAVNTTGTVQVTAPVAGTALPAITFSAALSANNPASTFPVANVAATTGTGTTLNIFDTISLGAGIDTLNLNLGGTATTLTATNTPSLGGVDILTISNQGGAFNYAGALASSLTTLGNAGTSTAAASTTVTSARATMTTLNLTSLTSTTQDQSITYTTGALAGTSDAATINLSGVRIAAGATNTAANAVDISFIGPDAGLETGFETVTINASGTGENRLGTLQVSNLANANSTMTALNLNNNSTGTMRIWNDLVFKAATPGGATGAGTVTATGTSGVDIQSGANQNLTFTGGAGNDTVRFSAADALTSADSINLGTGTNTLWVADATINTTTTVALNALINAVTTAQNVGFSAASAVNLNAITANNIYVGLAGAGGTYTFTNVSATDNINALGVTVGAMTLVASVGFNTLNLNAIATADAAAGYAATDVTGQATVNIASTSTGTQAAVNTIAAVTNGANTVVNVTGTQSLTITSFSDSVALNASAFTGILTATGSNTASIFTGGSGNDVITGGTGADTFVGGAGSDTINTGVDGAIGTTITGGLGADTIALQHTDGLATTALNATAAESYATTGQFDTVTTAALNAAGVAHANTITVTTGLLSSTLVGATAVVIGTTVVAAGSFLWVSATGVLTTTASGGSLFQDSNSSGVIDATDLQINFAITGDDTLAITTVGGKATVTAVDAA